MFNSPPAVIINEPWYLVYTELTQTERLLACWRLSDCWMDPPQCFAEDSGWPCVRVTHALEKMRSQTQSSGKCQWWWMIILNAYIFFFQSAVTTLPLRSTCLRLLVLDISLLQCEISDFLFKQWTLTSAFDRNIILEFYFANLQILHRASEQVGANSLCRGEGEGI